MACMPSERTPFDRQRPSLHGVTHKCTLFSERLSPENALLAEAIVAQCVTTDDVHHRWCSMHTCGHRPAVSGRHSGD